MYVHVRGRSCSTIPGSTWTPDAPGLFAEQMPQPRNFREKPETRLCTPVGPRLSSRRPPASRHPGPPMREWVPFFQGFAAWPGALEGGGADHFASQTPQYHRLFCMHCRRKGFAAHRRVPSFEHLIEALSCPVGGLSILPWLSWDPTIARVDHQVQQADVEVNQELDDLYQQPTMIPSPLRALPSRHAHTPPLPPHCHHDSRLQGQ